MSKRAWRGWLSISWLTAALISVGCGAGRLPEDDESAALADASPSGMPDAPGGFGADAPSSDATSHACRTDKDCDDGDPCTKDGCEILSGEFGGVCGHQPICDAGPPTDSAAHQDSAADAPTPPTPSPPDSGLPPPVESCPAGCSVKSSFPAATPLVTTVPSTCTAGFELNNPTGGGVYTFKSKALGGSGASPLEIHFATYLVPDHFIVSGITAAGEYKLFDTCTVQTASYSDPTDGCHRPPDETLRQYKVTLKAGTTGIKVDVSGVCSPAYLRIRGLCEFTIAPFFSGCGFSLVP